jgi:hypothetical protein
MPRYKESYSPAGDLAVVRRSFFKENFDGQFLGHVSSYFSLSLLSAGAGIRTCDGKNVNMKKLSLYSLN